MNSEQMKFVAALRDQASLFERHSPAMAPEDIIHWAEQSVLLLKQAADLLEQTDKPT